MYRGTDGLTTASIGEPSGGRLQPGAEIPGAPGQSSAPANVSQSFPGDYRQPAGADPAHTGSVPGAARAASSPAGILSGQSAVSRASLPATGANPGTGAAQAAARVQVGQANAAVTQPFPPSPAERAEASRIARAGEMAPDPIVTGSTPSGGNRTVVVGSGETLSGIARRFGVPANEIMRANNIADASKIRSGQLLVIPGVSGDVADAAGKQPQPQQPARDVAVLPSAPAVRNPQGGQAAQAEGAQVAAANGAAQPARGGSAAGYSVQPGDTLTKIARKHGVSVDALKSANAISGTSLKVGQMLVIPAASAATPDPVTTASVPAGTPKPQSYAAPKAGAAETSVTETASAAADAKAPASTGIDKLRWPARGQIITGYAQKGDDGKRNDGIDISMPVGSPVKAAENGVVIYSGDGLKDYGNTVLVRHDNGLVTVYANADTLNVKRGDKVQRGQVIASSGMSGKASTPRLHFEVRKNATPVDPTGFLE